MSCTYCAGGYTVVLHLTLHSGMCLQLPIACGHDVAFHIVIVYHFLSLGKHVKVLHY